MEDVVEPLCCKKALLIEQQRACCYRFGISLYGVPIQSKSNQGYYFRVLWKKENHRSIKYKEGSDQVIVNLDGSGTAAINTGIGFFDHMLELFAVHGLFDLTVDVVGDLHVDAHPGWDIGVVYQENQFGKVWVNLKEFNDMLRDCFQWMIHCVRLLWILVVGVFIH